MNNDKNKNLKEEIFETIIWFDLFSHPLTTYEIFKYLKTPSNLNDIISSLDELSDKVKNKNGFYYLNGREEIVMERFKRLNYFKKKIKKAKKFVKLISFFPFVKGVAVSNIIGNHNLKKSSDIDLFIISSSNKIWLTRFFCVFLAKILHLRPNKKTKENKICLSFYISENNLNLEKYLLSYDDLYFIYWMSNLQMIFSRSQIWEKFWQKNVWLKKYLPNFSFPCVVQPDELTKTENLSLQKSSSLVESFFKKIQLKLMPAELKNQAYGLENKSTGVILEDNIIKLFVEDKRAFFINQYEENIRKNN